MSTLRNRALSSGSTGSHAILDASECRLAPAIRPRSHRRRSGALALLLLLLIPLPNPAHSGTVRVPFHTVQSLIVVEGRVNGNPATFLLDTGSNRTIVSTKIYGDARFDLQRAPHRPTGPGLVGYSLRRSADVQLGDRVWTSQQVSVMDLDDLQQTLHMAFEGLLGQDMLRQFHSVRIDYHAHFIELQE